VCVCVCVCAPRTHAHARSLWCTHSRTSTRSLSLTHARTHSTHLLFVDAMRAGTVIICRRFSKVRALVYLLYKTHYIEHV
jgi:hypothetical protein